MTELTTLDSQEFQVSASMPKPTQIPARSPMASFFSPASVALIGATDREGSVGCTVLRNLQNDGYKGRVFPVNPKHTEIFGLPCYPSVAAIPEPVELVIVVTPAATVPGSRRRLRQRRRQSHSLSSPPASKKKAPKALPSKKKSSLSSARVPRASSAPTASAS